MLGSYNRLWQWRNISHLPIDGEQPCDTRHRGAANSTLYTAVDLGMGLRNDYGGTIAQNISLSAIFWMSAGLSVWDCYSSVCL